MTKDCLLDWFSKILRAAKIIEQEFKSSESYLPSFEHLTTLSRARTSLDTNFGCQIILCFWIVMRGKRDHNPIHPRIRLASRTAASEFWEVSQFHQMLMEVVRKARELMYCSLVIVLQNILLTIYRVHQTSQQIHEMTCQFTMRVAPFHVESVFIFTMSKIDSCLND